MKNIKKKKIKKKEIEEIDIVNAIASICIMLNTACIRNDASFIPTAFLQIQIIR